VGHFLDVVENHHVGHKLVVFDDFPLLMANIFGDNALASEEEPFDKTVKFLTFVSG